jgi:pimeloyl-ACP methyl ester carboxylesterase
MRYLIAFVLGLFTLTVSAQPSDTLTQRSYFTSADGFKLYYEVKGKGVPVLLVHGFVVNSESWKRGALYKNLTRNGFQVITIDLRGNGKSDKPHTKAAYENDAEAKDIMKLMDILKIKKYHVVGYSRGAIITARLLVLDKRVKRAVLGGMGLDFTNPEWPRRKMFYRALMGEPEPELEGFIKYVKESGLDQQALAYMQHGQPHTPQAVLKKIRRPVLVICGTEDEDNGSSKALADLISGAAYVRVQGNHNNTASTNAFSEEVIAFLNK